MLDHMLADCLRKQSAGLRTVYSWNKDVPDRD